MMSSAMLKRRNSRPETISCTCSAFAASYCKMHPKVGRPGNLIGKSEAPGEYQPPKTTLPHYSEVLEKQRVTKITNLG